MDPQYSNQRARLDRRPPSGGIDRRPALYSQFVPRRRSTLLLALLPALSGCRQPGGYPPPDQRPVSKGRDPGALGLFIRLGDPFAEEYIVRDVTSEKVEWRWTFVRPEFKFQVKDPAGLRFVMEFFVTGVTFRQTGPIVVTCYVNQKAIGTMPCPKPCKYRFEKPVPDGWIAPDSTVAVAAEADRRFTSPDDGAQLSFLVGAVGFTR